MMLKSLHVTAKNVRRRSSLRTSLFFQAFFLLLICVIGTAIVSYVLARQEFIGRSMKQLQEIVHNKGMFFTESIAKQREEISRVARTTRLTDLSSVTKMNGFASIGTIDSNGRQTLLAGNPVMFKTLAAKIPQDILQGQATTFTPLFDEHGWAHYSISAPRVETGKQNGVLVAFFEAEPLTSEIFINDVIESSADIVLTRGVGDSMIVLHQEGKTGKAVRIYGEGASRIQTLIENAELNTDGILKAHDYAGISVLAAYSALPSLGWSIAATVDTYEVAAPIIRLAMNLLAVGLLLGALLSLSMFFLAKRIVGPLETLASKLKGLETKHWNFTRSIFTRNELEEVDEAAADLTERLQAAHGKLEDILAERLQSLKREIAENATILESMDYGLMLTDPAGKITYINQSGSEFIAKNKKNYRGTIGTEALQIIDKEGNRLKDDSHPITKVLLTKERYQAPIDAEYSLIRDDQTTTPIQIRATPILSGTSFLGVVVIFRDVTEERHVDHIKSEFISLVSHQLRTPLSSMRWYLEMLLSLDAGPLTQDQREYVEEVATSNTRMIHLVNALLNVSRLELGTMQVIPELVHLQKLVADTLSTLDFEVHRKKITVQSTTDINHDITVQSDRGLLQLILENIMSNAVKYANENSILRVKIAHDVKVKHYVITVENDGIEIPENQKQSIGKKLFRTTNARLTNTDGNGLGLYISNIAAESIGAKMDFESVGGTTIFILSIPV